MGMPVVLAWLVQSLTTSATGGVVFLFGINLSSRIMNNMKKILLLLLSAKIVPLALALEPQQIAEKASAAAYYQGEDGRAEVRMVITDSRGRERNREMTILRRNDGPVNGHQRFFVFFRAPADVRETAFLVWKNPAGDDERWLYLPALDLVRRIAASDVRTSFVGSQFFYEDVSGRSPHADVHELISEDENFFVLRSTPKENARVEFDYYVTHVHRETFLPVKTEYFRRSDEPYRVYEVLAVETVQGFPTIMQARMTDRSSGAFTVLTYSNVSYNLGLGQEIFTEPFLRNPPPQAIR